MGDKKGEDRFTQKDHKWILRAVVIAIVDICGVFASYGFALLLRFEFKFDSIPADYINIYWKTIAPYTLAAVLLFLVMRLYHSIWRYASVSELARLIIANGLLIGLYVIVLHFLKLRMPISYHVIGGGLSLLVTTAIRFSYRLFRTTKVYFKQRNHSFENNILIVGGGSAGRMLALELAGNTKLDSKVCCIVDDNPIKKGRLLNGIPIVGNRFDIPNAVSKYQITEIILAIPAASAKDKKAIIDICKNTGCKVRTVPGIYQLVDGEVSVSKLRDVSVDELLGREQIVINSDEIHRFISNRVIMVTGGGGSIGSEICRQVAKERPAALIIFDIYENNAYDIQQELRRRYPNLNLIVLIGSVRNTARVNWILDKYKPDVVFHAAAHKHVPLMEDSPNEAIKNNVFGTYKMAKAAAEYNVKRFILISTDKAVNPTNIMGASKRMCEMVVQMMNRHSNTEFVAVRFGNVLGSNGSVIPLFRKQIAAGGPVTVTDKRIIRFFMTIPEAVSLVLQAGIYAKGGEIFVLDMGDPVSIDEMARNLIRLSGYEPDVDIEIKYTGLRPGEKLYEEILMDEEGLKETPNKLIHIAEPIRMDDALFKKQLESLEVSCDNEVSNMKEIVAGIVETYHPGEIG